jgi:putative ABC transport system permease protein
MGEWLRELRVALRAVARAPGYATVVLVTLALGVGANAALFSVLRAVLLEPLPQQNGHRVVRVFQPNTAGELTGLSPLEIADYRAAPSIEAIVEYHSMPFTFLDAGEPQRLQTGVVSADYFDALGVRALVGRTFRPGEDQPGSDPVLVLSHDYWLRAFGGDPGVVGRTLRMNDRTHTVVGVLPRVPQHPNENDVFMPVSSCPFRASPGWAESRTARQPAFALIRAGRTVEQATTELGTVAARLHATYPEAYPAERNFTVRAVPLAELLAGGARPPLLVLLGATLFLLLLVCANLVNLAVVRMLRRRAEFATRLALGATRGRIARQLALEAGVLGVAGGALGVAVAYGMLPPLAGFVAQLSPRAHEVRLDGVVLAAALLVALAAGVGAALLPLVGGRWRIAATMAGGGRVTGGRAQNALRSTLIVLQVAVSIVLLAGAALLTRSLLNLHGVTPGFDPARVLTARIDPNWTRYDTTERSAAFFRAIEDRLGANAAVTAVAFASSFPLNGDPASRIAVTLDGADAAGGAGEPAPRLAINSVGSGYFDALGVPVLRGRTLADADAHPNAELAVVATRAAAARMFGEAEPIGRRVSLDGGETWGAVVGVVGDVRQELESDFEAMLFVHHYRFHGIGSRLLVRGAGAPAELEALVRAAVREADAEQPVTDVATVEALRGRTLAPRRVVAALVGAFALLALGITVVGLAGVVAFAVAQRTGEIGIRLALGATRAGILALVLRHAVLLTVLGVAAGGALALALGRLLTGLLFGVPAADPRSFALVAALFLAAAGAAALGPARAALRIDPARAMRKS